MQFDDRLSTGAIYNWQNNIFPLYRPEGRLLNFDLKTTTPKSMWDSLNYPHSPGQKELLSKKLEIESFLREYLPVDIKTI